jgi:hypothetical protein
MENASPLFASKERRELAERFELIRLGTFKVRATKMKPVEQRKGSAIALLAQDHWNCVHRAGDIAIIISEMRTDARIDGLLDAAVGGDGCEVRLRDL